MLVYTDQLFITPELSKVQIISVPCQITSTMESKWATVKSTSLQCDTTIHVRIGKAMHSHASDGDRSCLRLHARLLRCPRSSLHLACSAADTSAVRWESYLRSMVRTASLLSAAQKQMRRSELTEANK